ncbi:hypothetical protein EDC01DRAFT_114330 [Geopyxis carbonaria]|nr:hypothetical protein EDC01DRAFT_114330 [Geopyxis carbonaria]
MSSVVNKSKNKFAPKAKLRARGSTSVTPVPKEPSQPIPHTPVPLSNNHTPNNIPPPLSLPHFSDHEPTDERSRGIPTLLGAEKSKNGRIALPNHVLSSDTRAPPLIKEHQVATTGIIPEPFGVDAGFTVSNTVQQDQRSISTIINKKGTGSSLVESEQGSDEMQGTVTGTENPFTESQPKQILRREVKARNAPSGQHKRQKVQSSPSQLGSNAIGLRNNEEISSNDPKSDHEIDGDDNNNNKRQQTRKPKKTSAMKPKKGTNRTQRGGSPADGEELRIEESVVKMKDLVQDPLIGKKSKRFLELSRLDKHGKPRNNVEVETPHQAESVEERLERLAQASGASHCTSAPQMRIVDGQIVLDEESLRIDRHQRDAIEEETMEIVEENQNTRLVNSATWSKQERGEKWDAASTQRYYEALSMFGTDFEMIAKLFPGRSRRMMKNKFNCEERKHPQRITLALRTRVAVDLKEYSEIADIQFGEVQELMDELQQLRDQHEENSEQLKQQAVELEKERQENANAAMRAEGEHGTVEPSKKRRKKGKAVELANEEILSISIEEYEIQRLKDLEEQD